MIGGHSSVKRSQGTKLIKSFLAPLVSHTYKIIMINGSLLCDEKPRDKVIPRAPNGRSNIKSCITGLKYTIIMINGSLLCDEEKSRDKVVQRASLLF